MFISLYRTIGNYIGNKTHSFVNDTDFERGFWLYNAVSNNVINCNEKSKFLELGTGWNHFYGIFLRHFIDAKFVLFDIQDNRQWLATKKRFNNLYRKMSNINFTSLDKEELIFTAGMVANKIEKANSFNKLYSMLDIEYILEPNGNLVNFSDSEFDVVFSVDVLEHINSHNLSDTIQNIYRILKPGGFSIHQIGIDDHLTHYASKMSPKQYLSYSDKIWKLLFQNELQYFNRKQASEYLLLFASNNFKLISANFDQIDSSKEHLNVDPQYINFDINDLRTKRAYIIHQKVQE